MNKTKIEWADSTWNPITGCLHGCPYCYARGIARRFGASYHVEDGMKYFPELYIPESRFDKNGNQTQDNYPYGFLPTFHRYRLDEPVLDKKPQNVFVGSMCDLFGAWVPDEWIQAVFAACEAAPWHRYIFLTKNPERYGDLHDKGLLPEGSNYWFGATLTRGADEVHIAIHLPEYHGWPQPTHRNTFVSVEPILDDIEGMHPLGGFFTYYSKCAKWAILGAETGIRKDKVVPEREWVEKIVKACREHSIAVFMKNSLADIWGEPLIQEYPW